MTFIWAAVMMPWVFFLRFFVAPVRHNLLPQSGSPEFSMIAEKVSRDLSGSLAMGGTKFRPGLEICLFFQPFNRSDVVSLQSSL